MDHCCDSMTTYLIAGALGTLIGCDSMMSHTMIWCMICIPFFTTLWEENQTKYFYLPVVNGVGEGTIIACIAANVAGFYGRTPFLHRFSLLGYSILVRDALIAVFFSCGIIFAILK